MSECCSKQKAMLPAVQALLHLLSPSTPTASDAHTSAQPCLSEVIATSLSTLQEGLSNVCKNTSCSSNGSSSCVCNSMLLQTAQAILQLSQAAVQECSHAEQAADALNISTSAVSDSPRHQQQRDSKLDAMDSSQHSSSLHSANGRRSSLRSTGSPRHSHASRRSVSFREDRSVSFGPDHLATPQTDQHTAAGATGSAKASTGVLRGPGKGSDLVVELPGTAAGLLSAALSGSSPVCLEIDLVLHEAAMRKAHAGSGGHHAPDAAARHHECTCFARTPSGGLVRRTCSDAGTPLSPTGKEVWMQVPDTEPCQLVDACLPHAGRMLELAVSYSQHAAHTQLAGCSSSLLHPHRAGEQIASSDAADWWHGTIGAPSVTAAYVPLREWQPHSPTRQGRYQRCITQQAQQPAPHHATAVGVGAWGSAGSVTQQQAVEHAAVWPQLCHDVATALAQSVLVLSKEPRCMHSLLGCASLPAQLKSLCEAAMSCSYTPPAQLLHTALQLTLAVTEGQDSAGICEQLRQVGIADTVTRAFSQPGVAHQLPLQHDLLELFASLDTGSSPAATADRLWDDRDFDDSRVSHSSASRVDARLRWSLRPVDGRQLPLGMLTLAAEAQAAQQRSSTTALKTAARLAALQSNSLEGLQLLGGSFAGQKSSASNIQLLVGSPLGTGLHTPGRQSPLIQQGSLFQLPRPAAAPCCSMLSSKVPWSASAVDGWSAAQASGRYCSQQPRAYNTRPPSLITAASAAGKARDQLHHEKLQSILGSSLHATHAASPDKLARGDVVGGLRGSQPHYRPAARRYQGEGTTAVVHSKSNTAVPALSWSSQLNQEPFHWLSSANDTPSASARSAHGSQLDESGVGGSDTCRCCGCQMTSCCGCCCDVDDDGLQAHFKDTAPYPCPGTKEPTKLSAAVLNDEFVSVQELAAVISSMNGA